MSNTSGRVCVCVWWGVHRFYRCTALFKSRRLQQEHSRSLALEAKGFSDTARNQQTRQTPDLLSTPLLRDKSTSWCLPPVGAGTVWVFTGVFTS